MKRQNLITEKNFYRSYKKRKEEKQEAPRRTRQEGRHSEFKLWRTRADDHWVNGSNRRRQNNQINSQRTIGRKGQDHWKFRSRGCYIKKIPST